jgi:CRISPR-associated protein Cmr6
LSSIKPLSEEEWKNIEKLLRRALKQGLGGKTSSGYGLYAKPQDNYSIQVTLEGTGVSSQLLGKESEFRPNLFKATLRGHAKRLLGGFTNDSRLINQKLDYLFGGSKNTGVVQIYWQPDSYPEFFTVGTEKTPSYEIKGKLYLDVNRSNNNHYAQDLEFIRKVLEFSLIMAGLGKSWRRIWHQDFKPDYKTRGIGCHWIYNFTQPKLNLTNINNREKLQSFLRDLLKISQKYISSSSREKSTSQWREAWHPNNVKVYCKVVTRSELINLFHDKTFKSIPAVGGKISITVREGGREKTKDKLQVSHVWHRMLPLDNNKYLEIITLFGKNQDPAWKNSKPTFEQEITGRGFDLINLNPPYN